MAVQDTDFVTAEGLARAVGRVVNLGTDVFTYADYAFIIINYANVDPEDEYYAISYSFVIPTTDFEEGGLIRIGGPDGTEVISLRVSSDTATLSQARENWHVLRTTGIKL